MVYNNIYLELFLAFITESIDIGVRLREEPIYVV